MRIPTTAVLTISANPPDDDAPDTVLYATEVSYADNTLSWMHNEDTKKTYSVLSAEDDGDSYLFTVEGDEVVRVRALDPYDGVQMSPARVPQPVEVLQAGIIRGGGLVMAQELTAVIAPDNTVVTLMLETGLGVYVRFSGDWQLLGSDSEALDGMQVMPVSPSALTVFDAADMSNTTLSAFDLPREESLTSGAEVTVLPEPVGQRLELPDVGGTMVASGTMIPTVETLDDLDTAIRVASANPAARWFVAKRAIALGAGERVPEEWLPRAVVRPF